MLDAACTSFSIMAYWPISASRISPTVPREALNSVSTTGLPSRAPEGAFGSAPGAMYIGIPPVPTLRESWYSWGVTSVLMYQTALVFERGCILDHILKMFWV